MSELARRRRGRDIWISRAHLWAIGAAFVLVGAVGFVTGLWAGGGQGGASVTRAAHASDASLVDLLARVDRQVVADDGVGTLTFPDALTGIGPEPAVPLLEPADAEPALVEGSLEVSPPLDLIVKIREAEEEPGVLATLRELSWAPEPVEGGLRVAFALDRADALELRDELANELEQAGITASIELRIAQSGPDGL
ncbi:MAG: hypothetical protein EA397_08885 [Deltaproteobacteria bacterium]|nr:MAG: hypothetical protein EA397_08885 [Deltaproteobacteria bacterium]